MFQEEKSGMSQRCDRTHVIIYQVFFYVGQMLAALTVHLKTRNTVSSPTLLISAGNIASLLLVATAAYRQRKRSSVGMQVKHNSFVPRRGSIPARHIFYVV